MADLDFAVRRATLGRAALCPMHDDRHHTDASRAIRIRGACQNNLKNLDLDLPTGELIVVTGASGSGQRSLVFDTQYAAGQCRCVETF